MLLVVLYLHIEPMVADMYRRNLGMPRETNARVVAVHDQSVGLIWRSLALAVSTHNYCLGRSCRSINYSTKPYTAEEMNDIGVAP